MALPLWGANGSSLYSSSACKYHGWVALQKEDGTYERLALNEDEGNWFKSWHWHYRIVMASGTIEKVERALSAYAQKCPAYQSVKDCIDCSWDAETIES